MYVWTKFEDVQGILEVVIGNVFDSFDPGNLDLYCRDPNLNRVPLLHRAVVWTKFEEVGQDVLELFIGNEQVTVRQTDQQTCAKQYALSFSKGGIKTLK